MPNFFEALLQKQLTFLHKIKLLNHKHSALQVLLLSANAKIAHLLRTTSAANQSSSLYHFLISFDNTILETFNSITTCSSLLQNQITQIRLPERLSGLGLLSAVHMSTSVFLGGSRQGIQELSQI